MGRGNGFWHQETNCAALYSKNPMYTYGLAMLLLSISQKYRSEKERKNVLGVTHFLRYRGFLSVVVH